MQYKHHVILIALPGFYIAFGRDARIVAKTPWQLRPVGELAKTRHGQVWTVNSGFVDDLVKALLLTGNDVVKIDSLGGSEE